LLSEVHASLLVHEELSHLADALENVLFDVMRHARERQNRSLNRQKPGWCSPSSVSGHWIEGTESTVNVGGTSGRKDIRWSEAIFSCRRPSNPVI
jgi:hypothetical protein